jgi:hypothetical protein
VTRCSAADYFEALVAMSGIALECELLAPHQKSAAGRLLGILSHRFGAILADDVGLGKSYVAAAVMAAMQRDGWEIELIVPAMLRAQWIETNARFGVVASITTHDAIRNDPRVPGAESRRLLVVDEAHRFRNPATGRYDALSRLAVGARCLLITATPICNAIDDLRALIELIAADDSLAAAGVPSIASAFDRSCRAALALVVRQLVVRRGRGVLADSLRFGALRRNVVPYSVDNSGGEITASLGALEFPAVREKSARALLQRFLWRRLESSHAALVDSVDRQLRFYRRALAALQDGREMPKSLYSAAFAAADDDGPMQEVLFWDLWLPRTDGNETAAADLNAEAGRLSEIRSITRRTPDRKLERLRGLLLAHDDPALVFTSSVATARALYDAVSNLRRSALLTSRGGRDCHGRRISAEQALFLFTSGGADVLVCTDMAGEGLNLQRAGLVIHYDLPWNPVKLEQRNGRIHRIGQTRDEVRAIYFLPDGSGGDSGIVTTIARKNRLRRRTLKTEASMGVEVPTLLGTQLVVDASVTAIALVDFGTLRRIVEEPDLSGSEAWGGEEGDLVPLDRSAFESLLLRSSATERTRSLVRPQVDDASPSVRLARRLIETRLIDARSKALLSRRYRVGVERLIAVMARGYLDEARREELLSLLEEELRLEETPMTTTSLVLAGIVGSGGMRGGGVTT